MTMVMMMMTLMRMNDDDADDDDDDDDGGADDAQIKQITMVMTMRIRVAINSTIIAIMWW